MFDYIINQIGEYFVLNIISLYIAICFFDIFMPKKAHIHKIWAMVIYVVYFLINYITFLISTSPVFNIFTQFILLYMITLLYQVKIQEKLIYIVSLISLMVGVELLVSYMLSLLVNVSINELTSYDNSILFMTSVSRLIPLGIVKFYHVTFTYNGKRQTLGLFQAIKMIIIPICSIFIMFSLYKISQTSDFEFQLLVVVSILLLLMINLLFYYLFDKLKKMEDDKIENILFNKQVEYYTIQQNQLEENFNTIKIIRHDLKHQLTYIQAKLEEKSLNGIENVQKEITQLIGNIEIEYIKNYSDHTAVNSILNYKISNALKKNINVDIKVELRKDIFIDEKAMCVILGNAIDNAVESFDSSNSELKKMIIRIYEERDNIYIKISNPYAHKIKFKDKFPVTNKKDKIMHGMGLKSIKKLVEDYSGCMRISSDKNIFSLEIILFDAVKYRD